MLTHSSPPPTLMEGGDFPFAPSHRHQGAPTPPEPAAFHTRMFAGPAAMQFTSQATMSMTSMPPPAEAPPVKKKRGRPRKYGPPSLRQAGTPPTLSSAPRGGPLRSPESSGGSQRRKATGTPGFGFTPHVLSIKIGEDVYDKVTSFMQMIHPFKSCILSASGTVADIHFKLPLGGYVLHKGCFGIVTLSGLNLDGGAEGSEKVKLMICVISGQSDSQIGGEIKGPLLAASDVQVTIGSFSTYKRQDRLTSPKGEEFHSNQVTPSAVDQGEGTSGQFGSPGSTDPDRRERDHSQLLATLAYETQMLQPSSAPLTQTQAHFSSWMPRSTVEDVNPPNQARNVASDPAQPHQTNLWRPSFTRFRGPYYRSDHHNNDLL